jgi:hypothetical protein
MARCSVRVFETPVSATREVVSKTDVRGENYEAGRWVELGQDPMRCCAVVLVVLQFWFCY